MAIVKGNFFRKLFPPGIVRPVALAGTMESMPAILIAAVYVAFAIKVFDPGSVFEYDPDEGYTLIKPLLLSKGFVMYKDIWSDQAPLFNYILWAVFSVFGWKVAVARITVLAFTAGGFFLIYDVLVRTGKGIQGHLAGLAACILLLFSDYFIQLSFSTMVGLPSVFAMAGAVWTLCGYSRNQRLSWLIATGILMGVSLGIKAFTAFLVPVLFLWLIGFTVANRSVQSGWYLGSIKPFVVLLASFSGATLLVFLPAILTSASRSMWEGHITLHDASERFVGGIDMLLMFAREDIVLFALAILGGYRAVLRKNAAMILWVLWLLASVLVLHNYYPIWVHHRVLLTVPAAVLSGYGIGEIICLSWGKMPLKWQVFAVVPLLLLLGLIYFSDTRVNKSLQKILSWTEQREDETVQRLVARFSDRHEFMVTTRQIYAFRARMAVPPMLGETSVKRFEAGMLDTGLVIRSIRKYKPRLVVLSRRWPHLVRQAVIREISSRYRRVFYRPAGRKTEVWVRGNKPIAPHQNKS